MGVAEGKRWHAVPRERNALADALIANYASLTMRMPSLPVVIVVPITAVPGLRGQGDVTKPGPTPDLGAVIMNAPIYTSVKPAKPSPFWQSSVPLTMTLTVNFKKISDNCLGRTTIAFGPCQDQLDKAP